MFDFYKLYYATVVDNDDTNAKDGRRLGRVQVRLYPEMEGVDADMLPWVRPFNVTGMKAGTWSVNIPPPGSKIVVAYIDEFFKDGYYLHGFMTDGLLNFDEMKTWVEDTIGDEAFIGDYPQIQMSVVNRQLVMFVNTATGYIGVVHKSGSYMAIDASGNIVLRGRGGEKVSCTGGRIQVSAAQVVMKGDYSQVFAKFFEVVANTVSLKGTTQPDPQGQGPFNCVPKCIFSGAPHSGFIVKNSESES